MNKYCILSDAVYRMVFYIRKTTKGNSHNYVEALRRNKHIHIILTRKEYKKYKCILVNYYYYYYYYYYY